MWLQHYRVDIDRVMNLRQEHIHPKDSSGKRRPLTACQTREKPDECKHGFPKEDLVCEHPRVLCAGLANRLGLPAKGKRNVVGTILPSRSSGSLNGAIPALLVGSGDNNDVKHFTRLVISEHTHAK